MTYFKSVLDKARDISDSAELELTHVTNNEKQLANALLLLYTDYNNLKEEYEELQFRMKGLEK